MFDPYREWLGVTEERRPPTLYQLLDVAPGEADPQVIEQSANRQIKRVQPFLRGPQAEDAKRVLEELTLARTTLLDPVRRAAYDAVFGFKKPSGSSTLHKPLVVPPKPAETSPWYENEPTVVPPPKAVKPPQAAPIPPKPSAPVKPTPTKTSFFDEPDSSSKDDQPSSSDGSLPSPASSLKSPKIRQDNRMPLFIGGGVFAVILAAGAIYFATKSSDTREVAKHDDEPTEREKTKTDVPIVPKKKLQPNPNDTTAPKKNPPKARPIDAPPPPPKADAAFKEATIFRGHEAVPRALAIAPDGKQLLSAGDDFSVLTWNAGSDKASRRYMLKSPAMAAAYLPNGKDALFCDSGTVFAIDLTTNAIGKQFVNPVGGNQALALAPDGKHFLAACSDGVMRWWDVAAGQSPVHTIDFVKETPVDCVALAKDGKTAVAGGRDGAMAIWDAAGNKKLKSLKGHQGPVSGVAFSPDGKRAASVGVDMLGRIWDVSSGAELFQLKGHDGIPVGIAYTPDNSLIITIALDQTIRAWDAVSGEAVRWTHSTNAKPHALAIDPNNRFIVVGLSDGGIQLLLLPAVRPDSPDPLFIVKAPPAERLTPPSESSAEAAAQTIRERYKADYALMGAEDKPALMDKLVSRARFAPEEADTRFALFQEASAIALKAGLIADAMRVVELRSKWFETDELADKSSLLRVSAAATPTVPQTTINAAVKLVEQAEKQGRPDVVDELMTQQELFAQSEGQDEVNKRIIAAKKRWLDGAKERETLAKWSAALDKDEDDKEANLAMGKRLCFVVGDWPRGLVHLAKGDDDTLIALAKKEKSNPTDGRKQIELADAWLAYAEKADDENKVGVRVRARDWFAKAEKSDLPNIEKIKVAEKRLGVVKLLPADKKDDRPGEPMVRAGFNTLRSSVATETQWAIGKGAEATKEGPIVVKADGSFRSRFKPQENWKITFGVIPDGRAIRIGVCGEEITLKPEASTSVVPLLVQRKGNKLSYRVGAAAESTIDLAVAKREPTPITFKAIGAAEKDGITVKNIIVTGAVRSSSSSE